MNPPLDDKLFQFQVPRGARSGGGRQELAMAEYVLKYADGRGQVHQQVAAATSEKELRDRYSSQGFLIYSIKPRRPAAGGVFRRRKKINRREIPDLQPAIRHPDPRRACPS